MALTLRETCKALLTSVLASNSDFSQATAAAEVSRQHQRVIKFTVNVNDNTITVALAEQPFERLPVACKVIAVHVATPISVTANDTNFATFTVARRTAGAAGVTIATLSTAITGGTGNITAFSPVAITLSATASNLVCAAGDELTLAITKTAAGIKLTDAAPACLALTVIVEEIGQ